MTQREAAGGQGSFPRVVGAASVPSPAEQVDSRSDAAQSPAEALWQLIARGAAVSRVRPAAMVFALGVLFAFLLSHTVPVISAQDEGAILEGAKAFIHHGSVRATDELNNTYDTNLIGNVFASYRDANDKYYRAFPGSILLAAPFVWALGENGFYMMGPAFGVLAVTAVGAIALRLTRSWLLATLSAALLATSPVFVHWSVTAFNNLPVLALELWALWFLLRDDLRRRDIMGAGALVGVAVVIRATEVVFVVPYLVLVYARTERRWALGQFLAPIAGAGLVLLLIDTWLFGQPLYQPHAAPLYIPPAGAGGGGGIVEAAGRYFLFLLGASSYESLSIVDLPRNYWFHLRYLISSSYAFPLFVPALLALFIAGWQRWYGARRLLLFGAVYALLTILFYGNQEHNYYGYGREIVRSSFVRYALPLYALSAIGLAAFLARCLRSREPELRASFLALTIGLLVVGSYGSLQLAYSEEIFGLDRLNRIREITLEERETVTRLLRGVGEEPLVIVGVNTSKVPDLDTQRHVIDIVGLTPDDIDAQLLPVIDRALDDRPVVFIGSAAKQDEEFVSKLEEGHDVKPIELQVDTLYLIEKRAATARAGRR